MLRLPGVPPFPWGPATTLGLWLQSKLSREHHVPLGEAPVSLQEAQRWVPPPVVEGHAASCPASAIPGSSSFLLCCPSRAVGSRTSPGPHPTGQTRPAPSMEPSETACPSSSTSRAPRRRSRHQQKDSGKHFIPRLSAALWPLAKSLQTGQGQAMGTGPRRQRLAVRVCPRKSQGGWLTLSGKSGTCCWLACPPGRDTLAGEAAQGGHPCPQPSPPTIFSRSRPLALPRSSKKAVSRSPHSGFLQGERRWSHGLRTTQPTCPPSQAPLPPSSNLHLRAKSKSTLL